MIGGAGVRELLPHRYPILLVDRVVELEPGVRAVTVKAVTANEPWYATLGEDVAEEQLAYPDVLLVESFAQSAGVLGVTGGASGAGRVTLIGAVSGVRFHGKVFPGDLVEHRLHVVRVFDDSAIVAGESTAGGRPVLSVERMTLAFRPEADLDTIDENRTGEG